MQISLFLSVAPLQKKKNSKSCMTLTAIMHFEFDIREPQTYFT